MHGRCLIILSMLGVMGCSAGNSPSADAGAGGGHAGGLAGHTGGQLGGGASPGSAGRGGAGGSSGSGGGGTGGTSGTAGGAGQRAAGGHAGTTATGGGGTAATGAPGGTGGAGPAGRGGAGGGAGSAGHRGDVSFPPGLSLLAGGVGGPGNVDGVASAARFYGPQAIAFDGMGNLYVADNFNGTVRKIVIATGVVTTLAGTAGRLGSNDGSGADASFEGPRGITFDGNGNLFVTDGPSLVRRIVVGTGAVTTIAGSPLISTSDDGTGTDAHFAGVAGIASDGAGNLYVADTTASDFGNTTAIRKIVVATRAVTTIAKLTDRTYVTPGSIALDGAGNAYVGYDRTIRKVVLATGAVSTLSDGNVQSAGPGAASPPELFSAAAGLAVVAGNLYVADGNAMRKVVLATGEISTVLDVGGGPARVQGAAGLTSDGAGNLYLTGDETVQRLVIASGEVMTIAGAGPSRGTADAYGADARFYGPDYVASDGAGNLYVTDSYNATIRQISLASGAVTTLAGLPGHVGTDDGVGAAATFQLPHGIACDGAGYVYVADGIIRKIEIATGDVGTLTLGPGRTDGAAGPTGLTSDGAGNLYFIQDATTIWQVTTATGALTFIAGADGMLGARDGAGAAASCFAPTGIASDGAGNLYVADTGNYTIRKIVVATKTVSTLAGKAGQQGAANGAGAAARFSNPYGIASDGKGNLYLSDGSTIRKIVIATGDVSTVIGAPARIGVTPGPLPASLNAPHGLAVLPTGDLVITDFVENAILLGKF